jgi:hypothetical protein
MLAGCLAISGAFAVMQYLKHSLSVVLVISGVLLAFTTFSSVAIAAYDPCYTAQTNATRAQRNLAYASQQLIRSQELYYDSQNRVSYQLSIYQAYVDQAYANVQASRSITAGNAGACAINFLFSRRSYGCFSGAINSAAYRQASANAQYNTAVGRRNWYAVYGAGYIRRAADRVNYAQAAVNNATIANEQAQAQYQQCLASNTGAKW